MHSSPVSVLSPQELLVAVELPAAPTYSTHFFHEFARRNGDYAIVGLAAQAVVKGEAALAKPVGFPPRTPQADRYPCRLRTWGLRGLHGARQWRDRAFLFDACGGGAGQLRRDDRRSVR